MTHLKGLFEELITEIDKASRCKHYDGIIFVHPNDVDKVASFIYNLHSGEYNSTRKEFTFEEGGVLRINTLHRAGSTRCPQHDYAGCEFTTIILHPDCFGKVVDGKYTLVNEEYTRCGGNQNFIMYMLSRKRSQSKHPTRMVLL